MAKLVDVGSIGCYFESLSDPRHHTQSQTSPRRYRRHRGLWLLCGCDGPTAIHRWAALQADWLRQHWRCPTASPHATAFAAFCWLLKPEAFQRCFQDWNQQPIATDDSNPERLVGQSTGADGGRSSGIVASLSVQRSGYLMLAAGIATRRGRGKVASGEMGGLSGAIRRQAWQNPTAPVPWTRMLLGRGSVSPGYDCGCTQIHLS